MRSIRPLLNSLRFKFAAAVLLVLIPLIILIGIHSRYSTDVVRNQVAQSNRNLLSLYMNQMDANLAEVDRYLFDLTERNSDLLLLEYPREDDETRYELARLRLYNELRANIAYYQKSVDLFFIYSGPNREVLVYGQADYGESYEERSAIQEEILTLVQTDLIEFTHDKWQAWKSDAGQHYLFHLLRTGNVYVGAWVKASRLMTPLKLMDFGEDGRAMMVDGQLSPMESVNILGVEDIDLDYPPHSFKRVGNKEKYLLMGESSMLGDFRLVALIPESSILEKLPNLQRLSTIIMIAESLFLLLFFIYLRKLFMLPIQRIVTAMRRLKDGNWQMQLKPKRVSTEFQIMNETYNHMISEIVNLKINVYEEKLNHQKAELKHLQLQINPHFFLNALNIIYNLAVVKDFAVIQEMARSLVAYFRFVFRSSTYFVPLKDELAHTQNYLRIQQLRFPDYLTFNIEVEETIQDYDIPPLILQTIVENAIKYAVNLNEVLHIEIRAFSVSDSEDCAFGIEIRDSGPGFTDEVLEQLDGDGEMISDDGEKVGIYNIKRRLKLLYRKGASITFDNDSGGGAVVSLKLPVETREV